MQNRWKARGKIILVFRKFSENKTNADEFQLLVRPAEEWRTKNLRHFTWRGLTVTCSLHYSQEANT